MKRIRNLIALGCCLAALGCGGSTPPPAVAPAPTKELSPAVTVGETPPAVTPPLPVAPAPETPAPAPNTPALSVAPGEPTTAEKYDAALLDALSLVAERKLSDALAVLESARALQDTEQVRAEIERVKGLVEQQAAAERTTTDIAGVLQSGNAEEAAKLATTALQQYGSSDQAEELARLKRQADALSAAALNDNAARQNRFRTEAEAAQKEKNLRGAVIALEAALQFGDDAGLRQQLDDGRAALQRYEDNRRRAAELRRDPANLEDAVAALQEAAKAWDTVQVRQEIDEYNLALQKRRDRLAVADFEVRGDVGLPAAGRTVAEELLPAFKSRFDLVERGQINQVVEELKLEANLVGDDQGRREVGRLARVRYLVVGSVSPLSGVTISARLVDVKTGLVAQTAKVSAPTPQEAINALPELGRLLLMTDEQRLAYEQQQLQRPATVVRPILPTAEVPPPPPPVFEAATPPPAPIIVTSAVPPPAGALTPALLERLPPPPPPGQPAAALEVVVAREEPVKNRLLHVSLEIGDNLFRRGRYREANTHFQLALNLAPGQRDVRLRVEQCRPFLPPPPPPPVVVVIAPPPPPPPPPPRLAVLNFLTADGVPPGLGPWAAENLAPYFYPAYEVVDRGEVFFYMGRLGLTLHDVVSNPAARRWLARALNLRAFVLGDIRLGSLVVSTHLVDAEYGFEAGSGRIIAGTPAELKLRFHELARLTLLPPERRVEYVRDNAEYDRLLLEAGRSRDRREFAVALNFYNQALRLRPGNVEIQVLLQRTDAQARQFALEEARRNEAERQRALFAEGQRRQWELARAAEEARARSERDARAYQADFRRQQEVLREQAFQGLLTQARNAAQAKQFPNAIQIYQSALQMNPLDAVHRELAVVQAAQVAHVQAQQAEVIQQVQQRQREAQLAQARFALEQERVRREAEALALRRAQDERDRVAYGQLLDAAQRHQAASRYDAAVSALQSARQLRPGEEVERLLSSALVEQARAQAVAKGEREKAELERQLAAERERRLAAEAAARRNQELFVAALQAGRDAQRQKRYALARVKYEEALRLFRTDEVLTGLRSVDEAMVQEKAAAEAARRRQQELADQTAKLERLLAEARAATAAKNYDAAVQSYTAAKAVAPTNVDVLAGLNQVSQLRAHNLAAANRRKDLEERQAAVQRLVDSGKANLAAKQYDAAVANLSEALKLRPDDAATKTALDEARRGQATAVGDARAQAEARKKAETYQKAMADGRLALGAKQYDAAIKAFTEAQAALPGDQASAGFLQDARKARSDAQARVAEQARQREEEQRRAVQARANVAQARIALRSKNFAAAEKLLEAAAKAAPDDADVAAARKEVQRAREAALAQAQEAEAMRQAEQKRKDAYAAAVRRAREATEARRFEDAVRAYQDALQLQPGDGVATQGIVTAQAALKAASTPPPLPATATKPATPMPPPLPKTEPKPPPLPAATTKPATPMPPPLPKTEPKPATPMPPPLPPKPTTPMPTPLPATPPKATTPMPPPLPKTEPKPAPMPPPLPTTQPKPAPMPPPLPKTEPKPATPMPPPLPKTEPKPTTPMPPPLPKTQPKPATPMPTPLPATPPKANAPMPKATTPMPPPLPTTPPKATTPMPPPLPKAEPKAAPKAAPPPPKPPEDPKQVEYLKQMQVGLAAAKEQKWADALKAYGEALKQKPGDAGATEGLRISAYNFTLIEGKKLLGQKKFADAAKYFEEALKQKPGDTEAAALLKQAKAGK